MSAPCFRPPHFAILGPMKTFRWYHGYDYSLGAFVFVTIATAPRRHLFGPGGFS